MNHEKLHMNNPISHFIASAKRSRCEKYRCHPIFPRKFNTIYTCERCGKHYRRIYEILGNKYVWASWPIPYEPPFYRDFSKKSSEEAA